MRRMIARRVAARRRQTWPELHHQQPVENKQAEQRSEGERK